MPSPEFVLSTLTPAPEGSPTPYLPRARYCIYRGMWTQLPSNKHNNAPQNPNVYESEMPTFTTDVRMEKVSQLFASSAGHADREALIQGSGGGGPVEAVWWVKEEGVMTQWRIKGEAFVIGPDIEGDEVSSGVRTVKSEVGSRMKVVSGGQGKEGEWSWLREMDAHFGNCSPGMRGSWKNPPPGQPKNAPYDPSLKLATKVQDLHDEIARTNFRVVVIKPESVEQCDISDPEKAHRIIYTYQPESGEWEQVETWP
ncbi:hypothetical protein BLS_000999 [Venturia inaequalis]|uniref:Pyridoxamine 5'-phosphate oxidase Alr4036 family FMN-binding domain-containing protein n=1 Tax=Venturia inaequalis TaxID=5025 RepID=A0A8H3U4C5_VENIN|nr:hypothetical protein BLS_000999 [Venturia inaequalis]